MRVAVLLSGGKDSMYALHWAFLKGFEVSCIIVIEPLRQDSWMFHVPNVRWVRLQAEALGLPVVYQVSSGVKERELEDLRRAFEIAKRVYDIDGVVAGALLSDYQRMRIAVVAEDVGLRVYTPLWRKNQARYMRELVEQGFRFMVTSIDCYGLPPRFLGRVLTREDIEEIIELAKRYGFNPAFEGGEAETFVVDAPLFRKCIVVVKGKVVRLGEFSWRFIIEEAVLREKPCYY